MVNVPVPYRLYKSAACFPSFFSHTFLLLQNFACVFYNSKGTWNVFSCYIYHAQRIGVPTAKLKKKCFVSRNRSWKYCTCNCPLFCQLLTFLLSMDWKRLNICNIYVENTFLYIQYLRIYFPSLNFRDSWQILSQFLAWQSVRAASVWNSECWDLKKSLNHGVMNMSGQCF